MKKNFNRQWVCTWIMKCVMCPFFLVLSVISFAGIFPTSGPGALQRKITLSVDNEEVRQVLKKIEETGSVRFVYQPQVVNTGRKVSPVVEETPIANVLSMLFEQGIAYEVTGDLVVIKPVSRVSTNQITISGQVTDAQTGKPLPGAYVTVKGTTQGAITDVEGKYSLTVNDSEVVLVFSFVGYISQEIPVNSRSVIDVPLAVDEKLMEEVVVVGYGTQKRANLTGAVSSISSKDFADRPITNVGNALQGKMPGVTIVTNNGQPGRDGGKIYIRGIGTGLGESPANSGPLVVVNGVVASLNELNPNDIENVTILKDAASAAIYGARASNGVILVTTKKGQKGKLRVNYDWYGGIQQITRKPDFLPSWDEAQLYNEARKNEGKSTKFTDQDIELFKNGSDPTGAHPNTDWLSLLYTRPGFQQNHNLSLSGGDEKSTYNFSLGYLDQQGNIAKANYKKYNARFGVTSQVGKNLSLNGNLGFLYAPFTEPLSTYAVGFSQLIRQFNRLSSIVPARWPNGAYGYVGDGSPLAWLESPSLNAWDGYTLTGNAGADWSPLNGLHMKPTFGYRLSMNQQNQFVADIQYFKGGAEGTPLTPTKFQGPNNLTNSSEKTTYTLVQLVAEYEKTLDNHYFKLLAGASREYQIYNFLKAYRQGFLNNSITEINAAPKDGQQTEGYSNDWALESFFGRFNYDYDSKYLLEANLRYDGSSRFAPGKRFGAFPSVSAGWVISEESFFSDLKKGFFNFAKLRTAWGRLGNQQISNYPTYASIAPGQNYSFNQALASGIAQKSGANTEITWETTESSTLGVDLGFFANKLTLSAEYFERRTNNILMNLPVGKPFGLSSPFQNAGAMTNKGWEFNSAYNNKVRGFTYDISGNLTYIENKVTELKGTGPIIGSGTFYDVGYPFQSLYGFESIGIYRSADEVKGTAVLNSTVGAGDLQYKDQNGDSKIDEKDRVFLGQYFPKITYGVTVNAGWKSWDLSLFVQGVGGVKANGGSLIGQIGSGDVQRPTSVFLDRWTPENHSATFPRASFSNSQNSPTSNPSSFWMKNASYLRMKNITLGYSLPKEFLTRLKISKVRFYYSGQNIFTITQFYQWIDPEIGSSASIYGYPQVKAHTFGINIGF